jgi:hypothetical protein
MRGGGDKEGFFAVAFYADSEDRIDQNGNEFALDGKDGREDKS